MPLGADAQRKKSTFTSEQQEKDRKAKMKLPIAIGVLFLVLVANTEAEEQDPTLKERFESFGNQMKSFADGVSEKTKSIVEDIHNSEIATQARTWLENMKTKLAEKFKS